MQILYCCTGISCITWCITKMSKPTEEESSNSKSKPTEEESSYPEKCQQYAPCSYTTKYPQQIKEHRFDRQYSFYIRDIRFKAETFPTVYLAIIATKPKFQIHVGVILETKFSVTNDRTAYSHLVIHLLFEKDSWNAVLHFRLCNSRDAAFEELQSVYSSTEYFTPAISPGFVSTTAFSNIVQHIKSELKKPFDQEFPTRLKNGASKTPDGQTNCFLFAARLFYAIAPKYLFYDIAKYHIEETITAMGLPKTLLDKYIDDIQK